MYRTSRDTSVWFDNDKKGTWQDRDVNSKIAPGMYQTNMSLPTNQSTRASLSMSSRNTKPSSTTVGVLTDKQRKISWNIGQVPFGSGSLRDLNPLKHFHVPGPETYEIMNVQGSKPLALKGEVIHSPQKKDLVKQQASPAFKNNENRISIYDAEEKRIHQLFGPKPAPEYTIKLNNELLEKDQDQKSPRAEPSSPRKATSVVTGLTVQLTEQQKVAKRVQEE